MSNNDNVSLFKPSATSTTVSVSSSSEALLQSLVELLQLWRENKKNVSEKIPDNIWDKIFILLEEIPVGRVLSTLSISSKQLKTQRETRQTKEKIAEATQPVSAPSEAFHEVKQKAEFPLEYKPAKAFTTKTCVVELYRPDGMLMKIHICTDRFEELLKAFYEGSSC